MVAREIWGLTVTYLDGNQRWLEAGETEVRAHEALGYIQRQAGFSPYVVYKKTLVNMSEVREIQIQSIRL